MANQNAPLSYVPQGVNNSNRFMVAAVVAAAMIAADTLTLTLPASVDPKSLPMNLRAWVTSALPFVPETDLTITSHDPETGVTVLTAGGAVAAGTVVNLEYVANNAT